MTDPTYTIKEILDIKFNNLEQKLENIEKGFETQRKVSDAQFLTLERDFKELKRELELLKQDGAKYKVILGIGATIGASLITFFANRII